MNEHGIRKYAIAKKTHEFRTFCKEINMARKQFKPRVHICRNEDRSLISNEQEMLNIGKTL